MFVITGGPLVILGLYAPLPLDATADALVAEPVHAREGSSEALMLIAIVEISNIPSMIEMIRGWHINIPAAMPIDHINLIIMKPKVRFGVCCILSAVRSVAALTIIIMKGENIATTPPTMPASKYGEFFWIFLASVFSACFMWRALQLKLTPSDSCYEKKSTICM